MEPRSFAKPDSIRSNPACCRIDGFGHATHTVVVQQHEPLYCAMLHSAISNLDSEMRRNAALSDVWNTSEKGPLLRRYPLAVPQCLGLVQHQNPHSHGSHGTTLPLQPPTINTTGPHTPSLNSLGAHGCMSPTLFLKSRRLMAVGRVSRSHAFDTRRGIPVGVRVRDSFRKSYMGNSDDDPLDRRPRHRPWTIHIGHITVDYRRGRPWPPSGKGSFLIVCSLTSLTWRLACYASRFVQGCFVQSWPACMSSQAVVVVESG